jgi:hypothetical protein
MTRLRRKNGYRQNVNTIHQTLAAAYTKLLTSLINTTLLHWQIENPGLITVKMLQFCEALAMCIECMIIPSYWLWETEKNFPELTSSRNKMVNYCGYPHAISPDSAEHFEIIVNNRPLSPRRPNFVKSFQNHALSLITTTVAEPDINSQSSSENKFQILITKHFPDSASQPGVAPLPTVQI